MIWILLCAPGQAYETDNLTEREEPLEDLAAPLNAHVNEVLDEQIVDLNKRGACKEPDPLRLQEVDRNLDEGPRTPKVRRSPDG